MALCLNAETNQRRLFTADQLNWRVNLIQMAVTKEQKKIFTEQVKSYKSFLDDIKKEISTLKAVSKKNMRLAPYVEIRTAMLGLQRASTLILMSRLSMSIVNVKNETYLNDARKEISANFSNLEKILGSSALEGTLTENKEILKQIIRVTPTQRLQLLRGFRNTILDLKGVMGDNSKWRWYFPDLHLKTAVLAKNLFDFSEYEKKSRKPDAQDYRTWLDLFAFLTEELHSSAQEYRSRYELSTNDVNDLQTIQRILEFSKKIYMLSGNKNELNKVSTSLDAITQKIELASAEKKKKK